MKRLMQALGLGGGSQKRVRQNLGGSGGWMRSQLQKMSKMNQGVVSGVMGK